MVVFKSEKIKQVLVLSQANFRALILVSWLRQNLVLTLPFSQGILDHKTTDLEWLSTFKCGWKSQFIIDRIHSFMNI